MSGEYNLITSQDRLCCFLLLWERLLHFHRYWNARSAIIKMLRQACFSSFIHLQCAQAFIPTKRSHSLPIISIQSRFAPLAQTYSVAGTTAVHLVATREGNSCHHHSHSKLRGLQQVMEVHFGMFLTVGWLGNGLVVQVMLFMPVKITDADHKHFLLYSLVKVILEIDLCYFL